jgi:hypothetical protein
VEIEVLSNSLLLESDFSVFSFSNLVKCLPEAYNPYCYAVYIPLTDSLGRIKNFVIDPLTSKLKGRRVLDVDIRNSVLRSLCQ